MSQTNIMFFFFVGFLARSPKDIDPEPGPRILSRGENLVPNPHSAESRRIVKTQPIQPAPLTMDRVEAEDAPAELR